MVAGRQGVSPAPEEDVMTRSPSFRVLAIALLCAGIGAGVATASGSDEDAAARGAVTYRVYCASCHGAAAHGDGKLAKSLDPKPADLTALARKNDDGVFPAERVREVIDGRKEIAEHGDRDMPVWGQSFQREGKGDQEKAVAAKLDDLVAYLASIQAPAEKKKAD